VVKTVMLDKLAELMRKMPNQQPHLQGDLAAFVDHCGSGRTKKMRRSYGKINR